MTIDANSPLGKGEAESSILSRSTISPSNFKGCGGRIAEPIAQNATCTREGARQEIGKGHTVNTAPDTLPQYISRERLPSGAWRYRFQRWGMKVALRGFPGSAEFQESYEKALRECDLGRDPKRRRHAEMQKYLQQTTSRARKRDHLRGRAPEISPEFVADLFDRQRGKCAVTGIEFSLSKAPGGRRPFAPSVDRVDNAQGYTKNNVRLVCVIVNTAMSDFPKDAFEAMCISVAQRVKR
jgi:hypothetical protein